MLLQLINIMQKKKAFSDRIAYQPTAPRRGVDRWHKLSPEWRQKILETESKKKQLPKIKAKDKQLELPILKSSPFIKAEKNGETIVVPTGEGIRVIEQLLIMEQKKRKQNEEKVNKMQLFLRGMLNPKQARELFEKTILE